MMETSGDYDFDFAVAGAGPAGTSAAISLAQHGHKVVLFERETFPRFHIGESLLATANDHFAALGVTERIEAAGFPRKWGARLLTHDGQSGRGVDFTASGEVNRPQTFQVCREEFDGILLERARELGVDVREGCSVAAFEFTPDAALLDIAAAEGETAHVRVRALVDATGRQGLIAKRYGLRSDEPRLANIAIYAHYKRVPHLAGEHPDDIRIVARADAGWFWLIPISKELMSVGVVLPKALYKQLKQGTPDEMLERAFADSPVVATLMKDAARAWPVRVESDFSYSATAYAGDRWILAGDAGSFLDPVFSTGVSIAMESGIEAAEALDRALARGDFSAASFKAFSNRQQKRFETFRRFVLSFYTPEFRDLFFDPNPPERIFRAIVTLLAGNWHPRLRTRILHRVFFVIVLLQKHLKPWQVRFRRDAAAGYPTEGAV